MHMFMHTSGKLICVLSSVLKSNIIQEYSSVFWNLCLNVSSSLVGSKKCIVHQETQPYSAVVMQVACTTPDKAMSQIRKFFSEYKI